MIEIGIAVAILGIITVVAITNLLGRRGEEELQGATRQVVALLREAQSRSTNQEDNAVWGVHFENSTGTTPFFALFKNTYSSTTTVSRYNLPSSVDFSSIVSGGTLEITFAKISGVPSTSTSINFQFANIDTGTAPSISRDTSGLIFFDDFNRSNL